ncbi:MAG: hydrogenase 3 maturation endopeptidase HyCI [Sedimentisphaerales bacterium]|nr:hydrogenase 3 maturation endopeptidase HyCI [Sedimentisphaerales bacterium]
MSHSECQDIFEILKPLTGSSALIVGIGNTFKGDDALGPLVCEELSGAKISADVIDAGVVPENYIQPIIKRAPKNLIIIDAVDFSAEPGTIKIFNTEQLNSIAISTHSVSPRLFIDMICSNIDTQVYFIGIQPDHTQLGSPVSEQVKNAITELSGIFIKIFPPV